MDDGDEEDLEEEELAEALEAAREGRTLAQEAELLLEAAWEALEMAISLYELPSAARRLLGLAEARERLGDAALQNGQAERALEEYGAARGLLLGLRDAGELPPDDRRLADIDWYLGVTHLELGRAADAILHYRQAQVTLRLRCVNLQRVALDAESARLTREIGQPSAGGGGGGGGGSGGGGGGGAGASGVADSGIGERVEIEELIALIDERVGEIEQAVALRAGS